MASRGERRQLAGYPGSGHRLALLVGVGDGGPAADADRGELGLERLLGLVGLVGLEGIGRGLDLVRGCDRLVLGVAHVGELRMRLDPAVDERSTTCERRSVERM